MSVVIASDSVATQLITLAGYVTVGKKEEEKNVVRAHSH